MRTETLKARIDGQEKENLMEVEGKFSITKHVNVKIAVNSIHLNHYETLQSIYMYTLNFLPK